MLPENKIIHGLWVGNQLSKVELLTINSFIYHGHEFHLWVYENITTPLPESGLVIKDANTIIPRENIFRYKHKNQFGHGKGSLGGFSDTFRYKLLAVHGGWYVDMDVTCLKPLDQTDKYVFRTHHDLLMVGNIMKCPPNSELMHYCYERASKEVDENNRDWHLPITILNDGIAKFGLSGFIREMTNPDSWNYVRKLLTKRCPIPQEWYALHWVNEEWRRNHISKEFIKRRSSIGELMKRYGVIEKKVSPGKQFSNELKLSWIYAAIKQFPAYFKRFLIKVISQ